VSIVTVKKIVLTVNKNSNIFFSELKYLLSQSKWRFDLINFQFVF